MSPSAGKIARMNSRPKKPRDINSLAFSILQEATGDDLGEPQIDALAETPAATTGRKGGLKGGGDASEGGGK